MNTPDALAEWARREDTLVFAREARKLGFTVAELVADADQLFTYLSSAPPAERPVWSDVAQFAEITAERDRARDTAVRLEQALAAQADAADGAQALAMKGALMQVLHEAANFDKTDLAAVRTAVGDAAKKFGFEL